MKFKLFGMEIDCGCDARRAALVKFWNSQSDDFRKRMAGKAFAFAGWKYTFDENGDVVSEEKVKSGA